MNLPAPLAIAVRTLADWLDDRLTIAAIGLATGYFGLGNTQWGAIADFVVGTAALVLVLVPDPRKRGNAADLPPIELMGQPQRYNDAHQNVGSPPAAEFERPGTDVAPQNPVIRRSVAGIERSDPATDELRQPVQAVDYPIGGADDTYPNLPPAGFGDRD